MALAAEAWKLREAARAAIAAGEFASGFELAARAEEVRRTQSGEALRKLSQWLREEASRPAVPPDAPEQARSYRSPSSSLDSKIPVNAGLMCAFAICIACSIPLWRKYRHNV
jgi:hypothetical protein